jgi:peptidyl-prolyl cis-trans isomerase D
MLQKIRDRIKGWIATVFLGAIAVVFVFWGIRFQSSTTGAAARVNGEAVPLERVRRAWQERQTELQRATRDELPPDLVRSEQQALLDEFIRRELLLQRTADLGYRVGDRRLIDTLSSIPALQVDGRFSRDRYAALLRQQGRSEAAFEADLRDDLQISELQRGIALSSFTTPGELKRRSELEGEQRDIQFAVVPAAKFESATPIAEQEIERWYEANKSRYMIPETVALQYVELTLDAVAAEVQVDEPALRKYYDEVAPERYIEPEQRRASHILIEAGDDDAEARARAEALTRQAQGGADFAGLARENSDDAGSKAQGGDLGWSRRDAYVAPFADAVFAMQKGQIRGPVHTQFGYHVIRLDDVRPATQRSFDEVRPELEAEFRREQAQSIFYERSQQLADESFAALSELEGVAGKLALPLHTIAGFTREGGGPFGGEREIIDAVFSDDVLIERQNSPPISLGDDRVVVLRVTAHAEPRQKELAAVRAEIEAELKTQAARRAAMAAADGALARLGAGAGWSEVTSELGLATGSQVTVERRKADLPEELVTAVFAAAAPTAERPTPGVAKLASGDPVLFVVNGRRPGTPPRADQAGELAGQARVSSSVAAASEYAAYVTQLTSEARIKRNDKAFE